MPDREFKVTIINILTGLEKRISVRPSTKIGNIKKNQSEMKNVTEIKNTLERIRSRGGRRTDQ